MATLDDTDDVSKILDAACTAVVEGESIPPSATPIEMIDHIVDYERSGRRVAAGLGLTRLRQHYETFDPKDLPPDEQSWEAFATKHLPLPQMRICELIGTVVHHGGILRCTKCGTKSGCECGCGAPYVGEHRWASPAMAEPVKETALDRAAAAITAHPEKSNRAIAAEIGVGLETVRRARKQSENAEANGSPDGSPDSPPKKRVGRDGRSYPATTKVIPPTAVPPGRGAA